MRATKRVPMSDDEYRRRWGVARTVKTEALGHQDKTGRRAPGPPPPVTSAPMSTDRREAAYRAQTGRTLTPKQRRRIDKTLTKAAIHAASLQAAFRDQVAALRSTVLQAPSER